MAENKDPISRNKQELDLEGKERREFLKKVGKLTATVPAVALLMAAGAKKASAGSQLACDGDATSCSDSCLQSCITPYGGCDSCALACDV